MATGVTPPLPEGFSIVDSSTPPMPEGYKVKAIPGVNYFDDSMDASGIPADGAAESFGLGMAKSVVETGLGAKDLVGDLSEEDRRVLDMMKADADVSGGWATGGEVVGELAQLAIPASGALKGAKAVSKAKNLSKANALRLALASEVGVAGGYGATRMPEADETRLGNAGKEAAGAVLGHGLLKTVGKLKDGLKVTDEAAELMAEGVKLTPGQATRNPAARTFEYMSQALPFLSKPVRTLKEEARESLGDVLVNKVNPLNTTIKGAGKKANKQLADNFSTAYSQAWSNAAAPSGSTLKNTASIASDGYKKLGPDGQAVIKNIYKRIQDTAKKGSRESLNELDNALRKRIQAAGKRGAALNPDLEDVLVNMRAALRKDAGVEDALKAVDSKYGEYLTYKKAATAAKAVHEEDMIPDTHQLVNAMKSVGGETRVFTGEAPLQETITQAANTIGRQQPNMLIDLAKGMVVNIPGPTPLLRPMANAAVGRTGVQKAARKTLDPIADALRDYGISGATTGAALDLYEE